MSSLSSTHRPPSPTHTFGILAVSGLGSDPFGSFANKLDGHVWLTDIIPQDIPTVKVIIIYGHNITLRNSTNFAELNNLASSFQTALSHILRPETRRPIVLIGHGRGGLLIKAALIRLSESDAEVSLLGLIAGCLFLVSPIME
jgi:hypothetical protein